MPSSSDDVVDNHDGSSTKEVKEDVQDSPSSGTQLPDNTLQLGVCLQSLQTLTHTKRTLVKNTSSLQADMHI